MVALLITAGVSAFVTMRVILASQEVQVPSLIAKKVPEAGSLATRQGLFLKIEGKRYHSKFSPDTIISQAPPPGSTLKSHRSIKVWLSLGLERLTIPSVEGGNLRIARLTLEQAGLPLEHIAEVDDGSPEGTVLVQYPPPGKVHGGALGVSLLVSRGSSGRNYLMPDLIGRKAENVVGALRQAGLKVVDVRPRSYPGVAPGVVLRQIPAAGHPANPKTAVSLDVSKALP